MAVPLSHLLTRLPGREMETTGIRIGQPAQSWYAGSGSPFADRATARPQFRRSGKAGAGTRYQHSSDPAPCAVVCGAGAGHFRVGGIASACRRARRDSRQWNELTVT